MTDDLNKLTLVNLKGDDRLTVLNKLTVSIAVCLVPTIAYIRKNLALHVRCYSRDSYRERIPPNTLKRDSYKEKTTTARKICQPSITIKTLIPSLAKVFIIYPSLAF